MRLFLILYLLFPYHRLNHYLCLTFLNITLIGLHSVNTLNGLSIRMMIIIKNIHEWSFLLELLGKNWINTRQLLLQLLLQQLATTTASTSTKKLKTGVCGENFYARKRKTKNQIDWDPKIKKRIQLLHWTNNYAKYFSCLTVTTKW